MTRRNRKNYDSRDENVSPEIGSKKQKTDKCAAAAAPAVAPAVASAAATEASQKTVTDNCSDISLLDLRNMIKSDIMNAIETTNIRIDRVASSINESIASLKTEVEEIRSSQQYISNEYEGLKLESNTQKQSILSLTKEVSVLKASNAELLQNTEELNFEVNMLKQVSMNSHLLISNVVHLADENSETLIRKIMNYLGVDCYAEQIIGIARFSTSNTKGIAPILVRFTSDLLKERLVRAARGKPVNCLDIGLGVDQRIYLNHRLTDANQRLLSAARKFRNENNFKYAWFTNGFVYLKKDEHSKPIKVCDIHDLQTHC